MAFIFDLSCYTVCFCIILTITRNTWVAVSFLPLACFPSLSLCLGLSYMFHCSVVADVRYSVLMYDAQWWTDSACANMVICILEWLEWEGVCDCCRGQFVLVFLNVLRTVCMFVVLVYWGDSRSHLAVLHHPQPRPLQAWVISLHTRKHSSWYTCAQAGFPLI